MVMCMAVSRDFWKPHRSVSECCSEWGNVACAAFSPAEATQMSPRALSAGAGVACECHKPGLCGNFCDYGGKRSESNDQ